MSSKIFLEYEKLFSDTFGKSSLELLATYTTPEEITAKNSFGIMLASSSFSLIIRQYLEQLKSFESTIAAFDAKIARLMATFDTKLETITGVGTTLATVIFSEIGGDNSIRNLELGMWN